MLHLGENPVNDEGKQTTICFVCAFVNAFGVKLSSIKTNQKTNKKKENEMNCIIKLIFNWENIQRMQLLIDSKKPILI